jgi:hypothetical protein
LSDPGGAQDGPACDRGRPLAREWLGLIDVAGLEVEALYGWFDRRPFEEESGEFVWVTRRLFE